MPLSYYIEGTSTLWIKDNIAPYGTNIYYVEKVAGYTPNGSAIFDLWEDFLGTSLNTLIWTSGGVSGTISDSIFTLQNASSGYIESKTLYSPNSLVELKVSHQSGQRGPFGFRSATAQKAAAWQGAAGSLLTDHRFAHDGSAGDWDNDGVNRSGTSYNIYGVAHIAAGPKFYVNYSYRGEITTTIPGAVNLPVHIYAYSGEGYIKVDWIRVRKYIPNDPTITVTTEGALYKIVVANNTNEELRAYQIAIPASSLGTLTATTSLSINPVYRSPLKNKYYETASNCILNIPDMTRDITNKHSVSIINASQTYDRFNAVNNSTVFNGTNTRSVITHATDLNIFNSNTFTLICWLKQNANYSTTWAALLSKAINLNANRWNLHIMSNEVGFYLYDADSVLNFAGSYSPININDTYWHMVAFVRNGSNILVYKDGIYIRTYPLTNIANFSNTNDVNIGCRLNSGIYEQYFNGEFGEILLYSTAYSDTQILNYYTLSNYKYVDKLSHVDIF